MGTPNRLSTGEVIVGSLDVDEGINDTDYVQFRDGDSVEAAEARIWWSLQEQCLNVGLPDGVVLQVGQEQFFPPVKNDSGVVIPNGAVVMATGSQGDRVTIAKAVTDGTYASDYMIGIATHDIPIGSDSGKVTTFGYVRDLDTSAWVIGTILYADPATAGGLTSTQPDPPAFRSPIAMVVRQQQNTGRIIVRMSQGSTLGSSDSNVKITNPQANDVLMFTANGYWENVPFSSVPLV